MAVIVTDRLQELFPHWLLGRREIIWLWLHLLEGGATSHDLGNFGTRYMCDRIANYINQWGLAAEIDNQKSHMLLPEQVFNWIKKNGRQPTWLLRELKRRYWEMPIYRMDLAPRERLIALFDCWNIEQPDKLSTVDRLNTAWVQHQLQDNALSWYASAGKEKQKCEIAWKWYQEHHKFVAAHASEFSKFEGILEFLDGTDFSQEEKLHHLEQIKRKFKAQQTQANRQGKKQTNLSLSDAARLQLDDLAIRERLTKTDVIELLIRNAHERGMPPH